MSKFVPVVFRAANAYDTDAVSKETGISIDPDEGVTQQQFAEDADINVIVKRFGLTGELPQGLAMPLSGDFTGVSSFHDAMNLVRQSEAEFMKLPAEIRDRFNNDPGEVIAFMENEKNRDEAIKLGILRKPAEKTRDAVQAIDELAKVLTSK